MDFVSDITATGRRFRIFALIDEVTRECIALEVDTSITGQHVTRYLNKAMLFRGRPKEILSDNGPEFTSNALNAWAYEKHIEHVFIDLGKPMQNGFIESFNGKLRDECLNLNWFHNLQEARELIGRWKDAYITVLPRSALCAGSTDSGRICANILIIAAILNFPVVHKMGAGHRSRLNIPVR